MEENHVSCPNCGYDLHGIPEVRCPECGFRYDHEALKSLADSADWVRLAAARAVIVRAAIAAALITPVAAEKLGASGVVLLLVAAAAYLAVFLVSTIATNAYKGPESLVGLLTIFVGFGFAFGLALRLATILVLAVGMILLAHAWYLRIFKWVALAPSSNVPSLEIRRIVVRHSMGATGLVIIASLLLLFVWVS
jgi:hypothetical protein